MINSAELFYITEYKELLKRICNQNLPWEKLNSKTVVIAGSSGLIGSCLVDVLMTLREEKGINCTILAFGRSKEKLEDRFYLYKDSNNFRLVEQNVLKPLSTEFDEYNSDYVIHLASNTHPVDYASKPIETILANIEGTKNLLDYAYTHNNTRFVYASSVEVYGENRGDVERFEEKYCGYIDCNSLRAGYPEGKRAGEALCQAYIKEKKLNVVIPRFCRIYGPTMLMSDTKALSQFIKNALNGENIVLKSEGNQFFSYLDVFDAVSGLLYCLFYGENGEAYNISDENSDITLKTLAKLLASKANTEVVFDLPSETEKAGFSKATKALLDSTKIKKLGWTAMMNIEQGLEYTIHILSSLNKELRK